MGVMKSSPCENTQNKKNVFALFSLTAILNFVFSSLLFSLVFFASHSVFLSFHSLFFFFFSSHLYSENNIIGINLKSWLHLQI